MLTNKELKYYNGQAIFPGANETDEAFQARANTLLAAREWFSQEGIFLEAEGAIDPLASIGLHPKWLPIQVAKENLYPWEAASTWILDHRSTNLKFPIPLIKIRQYGKQRGFISRLYPKEEVVMHEAIHGVRSHLNSPHFEEVIAYHCSASRLRKVLGPFFESAGESLIFMVLLGISLLSTALLFSFNSSWSFWLFLSAQALIFFIVVFGSARLAMKRVIWRRLLDRVKFLFPEADPLGIAVRFDDATIRRIIELPQQELAGNVREWAKRQLVWKQLLTSYTMIKH